MNFRNPENIEQLDSDILYNVLLKPVSKSEDRSNLKTIFQDCIRKHGHLFSDKIFKTKINTNELSPDGNTILEYILPAVRKVYSKFYIDVPPLFVQSNEFIKDNRLDLFQLQFNLEEFLIQLSTKFKKNFKILEDFEYLDTASEISTLIVDNYVAEKLKYILDKSKNEIKQEIRDQKMNKHLGL